MGLDPKNVKYKNINNAAIAYNNYSKFINPTNDPNLPGYNSQFETAEPGELRKGLQTLFTTPETYYGPVQSNFEQLGLMDAAAFGVASLGLAGVGLLAPREYGLAGTPFTPGFQNTDESPYSTALRAALGIGTGEVSKATSATKKGIESLSDKLRAALSSDTTSSPVKSVNEQAPVQGFEDAKSRFSTGVSRPDVNLNVAPSKGLQGFFDEPTPDNPVPGVSLQGVAEQDVLGFSPNVNLTQQEATLYDPTDFYGMLTGQLAPSSPYGIQSIENVMDRKLSEGMSI